MPVIKRKEALSVNLFVIYGHKGMSIYKGSIAMMH